LVTLIAKGHVVEVAINHPLLISQRESIRGPFIMNSYLTIAVLLPPGGFGRGFIVTMQPGTASRYRGSSSSMRAGVGERPCRPRFIIASTTSASGDKIFPEFKVPALP